MPEKHSPATVVGQSSSGDNRPDIRGDLVAAQPGRRRRAVLTQHVTDVAAQVLDVPPDAIDPGAPLATLGLTSAGILELRTRLEATLEVTLPVTLGWQFPTLDTLVPHLAERMGIDLDPVRVGRSVVPDPSHGPSASPVNEVPVGDQARKGSTPAELAAGDDVALDELSDGELVALLMARIDLMGDVEAR